MVISLIPVPGRAYPSGVSSSHPLSGHAPRRRSIPHQLDEVAADCSGTIALIWQCSSAVGNHQGGSHLVLGIGKGRGGTLPV
jgi:hypothetical protein